ncbi:serine/threonine-protein kinase PBS1-like [Humulus lupulus]|uniref:serine/threonine-protein kinase PBS1-like n=1 Tax=Humulus lupulus TaxID=3486 RepID=UPI002B40E418|nr:serine/threonine-protein kinase PBS1-like [Humulus lupulus]
MRCFEFSSFWCCGSNSSKHSIPKKTKITTSNDDEEEEAINSQNQPPQHSHIIQEPSSTSSGAAEEHNNNSLNPRSNLPQIFTYNELVAATNNFSDFVKVGAFGYVFKGTLPNSNQVVIVKTVGETEYIVETHMLSILRHPNLITLFGHYSQWTARTHLLVYEFMPLDSLEDHLFDHFPRTRRPLDWNTRMKIALGVAKGLEFLHRGIGRRPVVHGDLKPSNILLGEGFHPKLSHFGIARFIPTWPTTSANPSSTRQMDSIGYSAPEYIATGKLSIKADIYSFGVVLLQLITGNQAIVNRSHNGHIIWLCQWVQAMMEDKDNLRYIADLSLFDEYPEDCLEHALALAGMCVKNEAEERLTMIEVVHHLEILEANKYHSPNNDTM